MSSRTKKASKKSNGKGILQMDPPIIVGGGGSAYVWMKLDTNPRPENPGSVKPPKPITKPHLYTVFKCDTDILETEVDDGKGGMSKHRTDKAKHFTAFRDT